MNLNIFHLPFPQIERPKERFWFSVTVSLFVYLFLLVFQPFGIDHIQLNTPLFLSGYMVITLFVLLINYFIAFSLFSKFFNPETWTVGKMLLMTSIEIVVIALLNWFYTGYFSEYVSTDISLFKFFIYTVSLGILTLILVVLASEHYLKLRNRKLAKHLTGQIRHKPTGTEKLLRFVSDNKNEGFTITSIQLLCIKAEGNYCKVFYVDNELLRDRLIRTSLTKLEKSFSDNPQIIRCHKSYIVNLEKVKNVSGNARNYTFRFEYLDFVVPVSRNFPKHIIGNLKV